MTQEGKLEKYIFRSRTQDIIPVNSFISLKLRSSNIKIWLRNTRWVACLHNNSLPRPPHWPKDKVKLNELFWTTLRLLKIHFIRVSSQPQISEEFSVYLNPLNPKIWFSILPSGCYTSPFQSVKEFGVRSIITTSRW